MSGLFAIVGPSGVGKDTLMEAARARDPRVHLVRRVITRPAQAGGEDFESISEADFARRLDAGDFVLHWRAHGLSYGIPAEVRGMLAAGRPVLFNGSRAALGEAVRAFPELKVIHVTARPEVLRQRLLARGRESAREIEKRLERARVPLPSGPEILELDNSGDLETALGALLDFVRGATEPPTGSMPCREAGPDEGMP
jgi:ribose 1,5-bisphosphokinase